MPGPTATISLDKTTVNASQTALVTITFSEGVEEFTVWALHSDQGTFTPVSGGNGDAVYTVRFTPNADSATAVITLDLTTVFGTNSLQYGETSKDSDPFTVDTTPPTVIITMDDSTLTAGDTSTTVTFAFSEKIDGLFVGDLTATNGAFSGISSSDGGQTWRATFTPTPGEFTTNVITVKNASVADEAGNLNSGATSSSNYVIDTVSPTIASVVVAETELKAGETSLVTFTFSEAIKDFTDADLTVEGGTLTGLAVTGDPTVWTGTFTPTANIEDAANVINLNMSGITDLAGNAGTGAMNSSNYAIDTARPTATIVVDKTALAPGESALVTITFSEAISGFSNSDLNVPHGGLTAVNTSDNITWTATYTPNANVLDTANVISLIDGSVADLAGNAGSTASSDNFAINTVAPTAAIALSDTELKIGATSLVTFTFTEAVNGFTNADLTFEGGTLTAVSTTDNITWTATFTPDASTTDTANIITLNNTGVVGVDSGNAGVGTSVSANYKIDTARPTATIAVANDALKIGDTSLVTFTFSEAVTGFTNADLTVANGSLSAVSTNDNLTWTATFTPSANVLNTTNLITLDNTGVSDAAGNAGSGTRYSNNYAIDTARPTANIFVADNALSAGETSTVTFTFSEKVSSFTNADLSTANGTLSDVLDSGDGITWTATFTPNANLSDTTNLIVLDNTGITDAAGNAGTGTTNSNNYVVNTVRPTATIDIANDALKVGDTSLVTITFSEAVVGFDNDDLTVEGGTLTDVGSSDGGIVWTATFTPTNALTDTSNVIKLNNSGVANVAGNVGVGETASNTYAIDTARPTATITLAKATLTPGESTGVTIKFSEAVTGFNIGDLTFENGTLSNLSSTDGDVTWTATFKADVITDTTNVITLNNTGVADLSGNAGAGSTTSANYTISPYVPPTEPGPTTPIPTPGNDLIFLGVDGGTVLAGAGYDTVVGLSAPDVIYGNTGDDSLSGGGGDDLIRGGQGADFVQGNTGDDLIFGDIGEDTIHGGQGDDIIQGNTGNDYVSGDLGNDTVLGGQGDDVVLGGAGDDYVSGDLGNDILSGGTGADLFNFSGGAGYDVVTDFSRAEGDHIRISPNDAADFSALSSHITSLGTNTVIALGAQTVILSGVSAGSLTAADFVFA